MTFPSRMLRLGAVALVAAAVSALLGLLHVPSPAMFGSLIAGIGYALWRRDGLVMPTPWGRFAQALVGVMVAGSVSIETLVRIGQEALPIAVVVAATIMLSLAAGWLFARHPAVDPVTGSLSMVAGGAAGVVSLANDLGADDRIVTVVQYLRVLVVLLAMPAIAAVAFPHAAAGRGAAPAEAPEYRSYLFAIVVAVIGLVIARLLRVGALTMLAPMVIGAAIVAIPWPVGEWFAGVALPQPLEWLAFGLIGAQIGLKFTAETLRVMARLMPLVLVLIVAVIAACAALGVLLTWLTGIDGLTAYLATTPGGLYAVVALAAVNGSDVTYVATVQTARLVFILLLLPLLARGLRRFGSRGGWAVVSRSTRTAAG